MRAHSNFLPALLTACGLAASLACGQPVITVGITVVTTACPNALSEDPQRDPMAGVDTLRFTLTGDGLSATTVTSPYAEGTAGGAQVPNVPLGTNRRIVAEALAMGTGLVRARADSGLFDVTSSGNVQLTLFLRVVDAFVFTGSQDSSACTHLNTPRAGHQMTQLADGRVLITGGYNIDATGSLHYLAQAELFDPRDGSFTIADSPAAFPRAGHAAFSVLVNGLQQVLLLGGEGPVSGQSTLGPVGPMELYGNDAFTTVGSPAVPRERAAMALDAATGYAVLAGGANGPSLPGGSVTVYDAITYFNPQQDSIVEVAEPLAQPIADAVGVSRNNVAPEGAKQGGMVIIGGSDSNGNASAQISGIVFRSQFNAYVADMTYEVPALAALPAPRVQHSAVVANDDTIFVLGGSTTVNSTYANATSAITVIAPDQATVGNATEVLSQGRGDGCAVVLQSGDLLYAGGAWGDTNGVQSTSSVDVITPSGQSSTVRALEGPSAGGDWGLQAARHKAACLLLADGTVLVTGGLQFQNGGTPIALGSAEIYTPPGQ